MAAEFATFTARFTTMGTDAHVIVLAAPGTDGERLTTLARERLDDLERRWSRFRSESELSLINGRPGTPVIVSTETFELIAAAVDAWARTDGRFDPTVGTSLEAAGYDRSFDEIGTEPRSEPSGATSPDPGSSATRTPTPAPAPTPNGVRLDPYVSAVTVPEGTMLDLGGIAKGAAADTVAAMLLAEGAIGVCINVGGDLRVAGQPPRPEGWLVDLACPGADYSMTVGVAAGAVCTTTKLFRRWDGEHGPEHHLRSPDDGRSAESGLASVVVIAARGAQAEVLAKAAFLTGPDGAAAELRRHGATGVLVDDDGRATEVDGLGPFLAAGAALSAPEPGNDGPEPTGSIEPEPEPEPDPQIEDRAA